MTFEEVKWEWESHDDWQFADRDAERRYFFEASQPAALRTEFEQWKDSLTSGADANLIRGVKAALCGLARRINALGLYQEMDDYFNGLLLQAVPPPAVRCKTHGDRSFGLCSACQKEEKAWLHNRLSAVETAIRDYYLALDTREHGGLAQDKAFRTIENALNLQWNQGEELERRKKSPPGPTGEQPAAVQAGQYGGSKLCNKCYQIHPSGLECQRPR